jgi:flagellar basal-body rod protein FlgG
MSNSIWIGTAGGAGALRALDVAANNLANSQTTGFKSDRAIFSVERVEAPPGEEMSESSVMAATASRVNYVATDFSEGTTIPTDSPTDFAVEGEGFFHLLDEASGKEFLTRDGSFQLDNEGRLVTRDGLFVLGENGEKLSVAGSSLEVGPRGRVLVDGAVRGTMALKDVADRAALSKVGGTRFEAEGELVEGSGNVAQGRLESSNVEPVGALVELIALQRYYEAFQKSARAADSMDEQLATRVGRKND